MSTFERMGLIISITLKGTGLYFAIIIQLGHRAVKKKISVNGGNCTIWCEIFLLLLQYLAGMICLGFCVVSV